MNNGLVYIFTGEGKGKTSAALGVAIRSLLLDKQVIWVAFYKQESWGLAEAKLKDKFSNLEMYFSGKGFKIGAKTAPVGNKGHVVVDTASEEEHRNAAMAGLHLVSKYLQGSVLCKDQEEQRTDPCFVQKPFLLLMDEVLNAVSDGLLEEKDVLKVLDKRGETHIVLTGRANKRTSCLLQGADLVTECKKIKHPYDLGKLAVKGLDF